MPTLLAINNYHYARGGAESVFLEHTRLFLEAGWNVVPFAMHHPLNKPTPWSEYFVDELEFGRQYSLVQQLVRAPRVAYSLQARRNLSRLLDRVRVDICHAHNIYHHLSPSILWLLHREGIPVVLTLHDLKVACPAYTMLARDGVCERCRGGRLHNVAMHRCIKGSLPLSTLIMLEAMLHRIIGSYRRCVNRFVVPSRFYAEKLVEWGMPAESFRHVPNFVDVDRYVPEFSPGERFVYFGRLSREKGLRTLVEAAAIAQCKVAVAGSGPERVELEELAGHIGANVEFLGHLSGESLHEVVRSARAVVLPSEWYENAPLSVLEAYALGKPVIGARIGGIPELVRDQETGYLFTSGNAVELAEVLNRVGGGSRLRLEEMGRCGRLWVEQEFTAAVYHDRMCSIYTDLGVADARAR